MHVVVNDPTGKYGEGLIINDPSAKMLSTYNVESLPISELAYKAVGVGGYTIRKFGKGQVISGIGYFAQTSLFVKADVPILNYAACIELPKDSSGSFRFVQDVSQHTTTQKAGMSPLGVTQFDIPTLIKNLKEGETSLIIRGRCTLNLGHDALCGFAFYGNGIGSPKCHWIAVSNSER